MSKIIIRSNILDQMFAPLSVECSCYPGRVPGSGLCSSGAWSTELPLFTPSNRQGTSHSKYIEAKTLENLFSDNYPKVWTIGSSETSWSLRLNKLTSPEEQRTCPLDTPEDKWGEYFDFVDQEKLASLEAALVTRRNQPNPNENHQLSQIDDFSF